jgi:hypothetical protein
VRNNNRSGRRLARAGNKFRHDARFERYEPSPVSMAVRHRLYRLAVRLQRKTKAKGRKRGVLTDATLQIFWCMLFDLTDNVTGACDPAIDYIVLKSRKTRSTVCAALKDLERVGLLKVMRRLVRRVIGEGYMRRESTVQDTNAYYFGDPHPYASLLVVTPVPSRTERLVGNLLVCLSMKDARTESDHSGDPGARFKRKESGASACASANGFSS